MSMNLQISPLLIFETLFWCKSINGTFFLKTLSNWETVYFTVLNFEMCYGEIYGVTVKSSVLSFLDMFCSLMRDDDFLT